MLKDNPASLTLGVRIKFSRKRTLTTDIQSRFDRLRSSEESRLFIPEPCLPTGDVQRWEKQRGVQLPEEYRLFLLEWGNGGNIPCEQPGAYCDLTILPLAQIRAGSQLKAEFPISQALCAERMARLKVEGWANRDTLFPELEPLWEQGSLPGCLDFCQYPGGDGAFLVLNGELRGTVWCTVCCGVPESWKDDEPSGFFAWFEDMLSEAKSW